MSYGLFSIAFTNERTMFCDTLKFTPECLHKRIRKHLTFHGQTYLYIAVVWNYFEMHRQPPCNINLVV